jgi:hypothetical protein
MYGLGPDIGSEAGGAPGEIQRKLARLAALKSERSSWDNHWLQISQYQFPRAGRFLTADTNEGKKKNFLVYDNTAI